MKDIIYYGYDELKYITLGILTERVFKRKGKISELIEMLEKLIESADRDEIVEIYKKISKCE